ncbi:hypothetical protein CLOBOL_03791 [Enterocloster bolteae ATCC BAA-613]|uniref:Uncharacterized protein n=1 Tax=Enterocloster bolteae (strain ATCC BAA-613 / DSM 15670 / CCUG 46953 / JCM 12243 / WAL 16351) TaxID=411902 RepID=A8RTU2_ENTBW|nr:hypothetical protein CLOBOL_03791 [Enterocloster bolteae ATCC BAA-613]
MKQLAAEKGRLVLPAAKRPHWKQWGCQNDDIINPVSGLSHTSY